LLTLGKTFPGRGSRFSALLLLALLALLPLGGAGCTQGGIFGPHYDVSGNPQTALDDGKKREVAAETVAKTNQPAEATRLWTEAASYYGAVVSKYNGTDTGLRALLAEGAIRENNLKDEGSLNAAHVLYRNALSDSQYATADPTLHAQLQDANERVVRSLDEVNSHKIGYQVMDFLVRMLGNDPRVSPIIAVFLIAVFITVVLWPLRRAQYKQAKEMQRFQPEMTKLREKYKDDPQLFQEKFQEFQREHGFNPFAGCLPAVVQLPVTLGMYQVILNYQFHFRPCTFLWINQANGDIAAHWPAPLTGLIGHNLAELDLILLVIYGVSMFLQTRFSLNTITDPQQLEQQKAMSVTMPVIFFAMMLSWKPASAFVLYWFVSNLLSMAQQWWIYRTLPTPAPLVIGGDGAKASANGTAADASARALSSNPKLVSPKNRRKK